MVAEFNNHRVSMFGPKGKFLRSFGQKGPGPGEFHYPRGVAFDTLTKTVLVADSDNQRIQVFSEEGEYLSHFATASSPSYIALDDAGRIYVTLPSSHQVQVFESRGAEQLFLWGKKGEGKGDLNTPQGIVVNRKGEVISV
jgi:DNA-binding beta-propeller fold protein YncE